MESLSLEVSKAVKPVAFKGIDKFFDISGLLSNPKLFREVIRALTALVDSLKPDMICALDARGFLIASPVALELECPLVMIRKAGKLPGDCFKQVFDKEYENADVFEVQCGAIRDGAKVVVLDDVFATGGSMSAAFSLVESSHPKELVGVCLMDLGLEGAANRYRTRSLFNVTEWTSRA